jgi:hypothetical protein
VQEMERMPQETPAEEHGYDQAGVLFQQHSHDLPPVEHTKQNMWDGYLGPVAKVAIGRRMQDVGQIDN